MNAAFIGLAVLAALNPKLLGVDLLLIENARPRLMFACFLADGLGISLAVGLLDVFVLQADAVSTRARSAPGWTWPSAYRWRPSACWSPPAGGGHPPRRETPSRRKRTAGRSGSWASPGFGLAVLIGTVAGTPGAAYITALHQLVTGTSGTAAQAVAVVIFVLIEFSLVIIPFAFLVTRPEATRTQLKRAQDWLMSHARQLMAAVALFAGAYMIISGLARLLS